MNLFSFLLANVLLWIYAVSPGSCNAKCTVNFDKVSFPDGSLTVEENTTATLTLRGTSNCTDSDLQHFEVDISAPESASQCKIGPNRSAKICVYPKSNAGNTPTIELTTVFDRDLKGTWSLVDKTKSENSKNVSVKGNTFDINVTYPYSITTLKLGNEQKQLSVGENTPTVQADCKWTNGNPLQSVSIRKYGSASSLASTQRGETVTHLTRAISDVKCGDAGVYRCGVDGTDQHREVTLLVECPPYFFTEDSSPTTTVTEGEDALLEFRVRTHTRDILLYNLTWPSSSRFRRTLRSTFEVVGEPPYTTVKLRLPNMARNDNGQWWLTVTNGWPERSPTPVSINFQISVSLATTERMETSSPIVMSTVSEESTVAAGELPLLMAAVGGVVVLIIIAVGVTCCVCRSKKNNKKAQDRKLLPDQELVVQGNESPEECEMVVNELYGRYTADENGAPPATMGGAPTTGTADFEGNVYSDADDVRSTKTEQKGKPQNSPPVAEGNLYMDAEEVRKNKKDKKDKKDKKGQGKPQNPPPPPPPSAEGDVYVGAEEVRKNKKDKTGKAQDSPPAAEGDLYVEAEDVRKNKKAQNEGGAGPDPNAPVANAEGCLYSQLDLKPSQPRAVVKQAEPASDYAHIDWSR